MTRIKRRTCNRERKFIISLQCREKQEVNDLVFEFSAALSKK